MKRSFGILPTVFSVCMGQLNNAAMTWQVTLTHLLSVIQYSNHGAQCHPELFTEQTLDVEKQFEIFASEMVSF